MLFNSFEFLFLFLPGVLVVYYLLNNLKMYSGAKFLLILASLYFYAYFNISYLPIILSSIFINYGIGMCLQKKTKEVSVRRKPVFWIGVIFNIGLLGYFKYADFFITNLNQVFHTDFNLLHLLLPLGISFFTFQQLAYVIDCYQGKGKKYSFLDYSLFVTFFPQLVAGPIVLPEEMLPQFADEKNKKVNWENMNKGFALLIIGLAKKLIIADSISHYADAGFGNLEALSMPEAWLSSLAYTFQLYFDFSGYCDMAIGIGLMFNIILPQNFYAPYRSVDIKEFWKRWHSTLGRFMTSYLYIPLGGNRVGKVRLLVNLFVVFVVSGLWHGAGWTFILWGAFHGIGIVLHRLWNKMGYSMNRYAGIVLTFFCVNFLWVLFRAKDWAEAVIVYKGMFNIGSLTVSREYRNLLSDVLPVNFRYFLLILAVFIAFFGPTAYERIQQYRLKVSTFEVVLYAMVCVLLLTKVSTFLYFNF